MAKKLRMGTSTTMLRRISSSTPEANQESFHMAIIESRPAASMPWATKATFPISDDAVVTLIWSPVAWGGCLRANPSQDGPALVHVMDWHWDPQAKRQVRYTQHGLQYIYAMWSSDASVLLPELSRMKFDLGWSSVQKTGVSASMRSIFSLFDLLLVKDVQNNCISAEADRFCTKGLSRQRPDCQVLSATCVHAIIPCYGQSPSGEVKDYIKRLDSHNFKAEIRERDKVSGSQSNYPDGIAATSSLLVCIPHQKGLKF